MQRSLYEALPADGVVIVSGDKTMSSYGEEMVGEKLWIGCSRDCDLTANPLSFADAPPWYFCAME